MLRIVKAGSVVVLFLGFLLGNPCVLHGANPFEEGGPAGERTRLPAPEPFSLSGRDAVQAVALLRRVGFVSVVDTSITPGGVAPGFPDPSGYPLVTIPVQDVRARFLGLDEGYPPGHVRRFDLVINGRPLEWGRTYIFYNGRQLLLQQLFTYRNQHPVPWGLGADGTPVQR
ncbi:MAG: hypothetical protein ACOCW6_06005 [Spirochaetota bacterium]